MAPDLMRNLIARLARPPLFWGAWVVGCAAFLAFADHPWSEGLDTSMEVKESIRTRSWVAIGLWAGAAVNLAIGIGVLIWFRVARNRDTAASSSLGHSVDRRVTALERKVCLGLLLATVVLGAVLMGPRLNLSLWGDEEATTRRYVVGHVYRQPDDSFVLKPPSWKRTVWNWDNGPSNQALFSLLARISHGPADTSGADPSTFYFSEWKVRLPSFLAALGSILATGWLVWLLGFPRGAPVAGLIMALHPLFIRYGTEARGYALMMFLGPLALCFLIRALQSTRLPWWTLFGVSQFLLLFAWFGSVYFLVPLNLAAVWLAWDRRRHSRPWRSVQLRRWFGATLLGAMLTVQFMMPNLLQLPGYLDRGRLAQKTDYLRWTQDSISLWASGMPWHEWEPRNPNSLTLKESRDGRFTDAIACAAVGTLLFALGTVTFWKRKRWRAFLAVLVVPPLLMLLHSAAGKTVLYSWYSVGFLPFGIALATICWTWMASGVGVWYRGLVFPVVGVALFAAITHDQRVLVRKNSVEPLAESIRAIREVVDPFHPGIDGTRTISIHHYSRLYDPAALVAKSDDEFLALLREFGDREESIYVNTANIGLGRALFPRTFALLENRKVFERTGKFWGMQQPCTRHVFRYRKGGLSRGDGGF